jgi:prepilin-type N-terminal cleavage/methylation domain-containing protein/prepilin-type processing-associated H-X9-DG protein
MRRHPCSRKAFTLVELMVVIVVIAILIALLLPAIGRARELGKRTACTNNVYQIGFAMSQFNDSTGFLPGWRNQLLTATGSTSASWPVMILAQIDRNDVYKTWTAGAGLTPPISLFMCPSTPPSNDSVPALAYAGISVTTGGLVGDAVMTDTPQSTAANRLSLDDIVTRDGTTTTLLLAERCGSGATEMMWNNSLTCGMGIASGMAVPSGSTRIVNTSSYPQLPSANHPGGIVAVFCDGHTAFIKETVAGYVFAQAMTSNSTWDGTSYNTNSTWVNNWLRASPAPTPYALSESDLK